MKENQITLINEDGSESLAEIILTHEANDKKYIIFEILETEEVSAAIFVEDGNEGKFLDIETDEEWDMLDKLLDNFYDSLEDSEEDDLED